MTAPAAVASADGDFTAVLPAARAAATAGRSIVIGWLSRGDGDVAQVMPGVDQAQALRHTAVLMQVSGGVGAGPGWLEVVLSWPRRFVTFSAGQRLPGDAAD